MVTDTEHLTVKQDWSHSVHIDLIVIFGQISTCLYEVCEELYF